MFAAAGCYSVAGASELKGFAQSCMHAEYATAALAVPLCVLPLDIPSRPGQHTTHLIGLEP